MYVSCPLTVGSSKVECYFMQIYYFFHFPGGCNKHSSARCPEDAVPQDQDSGYQQHVQRGCSSHPQSGVHVPPLPAYLHRGLRIDVVYDTECPYWDQVSLNSTNTQTQHFIKDLKSNSKGLGLHFSSSFPRLPKLPSQCYSDGPPTWTIWAAIKKNSIKLKRIRRNRRKDWTERTK